MTFQTTIARLREASYAPATAGENPSTCRVDRQDLRTALHVIDRLDADLRHAGVITHGTVADAASQASEADPLQGAANWLAQAHGQFSPLSLSASLMIGYNRARRLYDAALSAQQDVQ